MVSVTNVGLLRVVNKMTVHSLRWSPDHPLAYKAYDLSEQNWAIELAAEKSGKTHG